MAVVIDDRLLLDVLAGQASGAVADELESGGVFTTGAWYYRLGRAAFGGTGSGALSGRLASLDRTVADQVRATLADLPPSIGLLHQRVVVPVMFTLRVRRQLNILGAEALAVALLLPARLVVTTDAALLRSAAREMGVEYQIST
ncbi:MAG: hypothetical protein ACRDYY_06530 [Acidimicrobiales bacterium]